MPKSASRAGVFTGLASTLRTDTSQATEAAKSERMLEPAGAVERLRESEERLRAVLSAAPVILFATDAAGTFTFSDGKGLEAVGLNPGERVGQSLLESYAKFPEIVSNFHRALAGEDVACETSLGNRTFDVRLSPTREPDGRISGVTGISVDITAANRAREQLQAAKEEAERANAAKSEFLSRMSHELRTPLNAILGFGQLLEFQVHDAMEKDSAHQIVVAGRRLLALIDEVLDISRVETGQIGFTLESLSVGEMVAGALKPLEPQFRAGNLHLEVGEGLSAAHVQADRLRLHQVLLNLLSNAVKFNAENGLVRVSCERQAERVRILVGDTGRGIAEGDLPKLFVPFERLDANERCIDGTGIGLALSKRLIESQGGKIGVESRPGAGSTFWIDLPVAAEPAIA